MRLNVENMTCGHCRATVEKAIASVDPAAAVSVDIPGRTVDVTSNADADALMGAIRAQGYDVRAA
ncbi:heavy-metal-associated domain-containing protein [uncultured Jannaschia sp.]|uniref:heavy-metal-associated domain-containing protein n=1 Tax=uncultured Jannaschia sp. TaxID=293347 RepID=UPI0026189C94|nr:heavy-metal-associated domain-containing protein [uncultured Jannaschia sp.]